jgi:hypothetical protein
MDEKPAQPHPKKTESVREARLKSALKANLARRKAQAKARGQAGKTGKEES